MKSVLIQPSETEDLAIDNAIADDADTFEITSETAVKMRFFSEAHPELLDQIQQEQKRRGRPKGVSKRVVSLSLDAELVDALRASGKGWQTRANAILRHAVGLRT